MEERSFSSSDDGSVPRSYISCVSEVRQNVAKDVIAVILRVGLTEKTTRFRCDIMDTRVR